MTPIELKIALHDGIHAWGGTATGEVNI